ncbi:unnamed protein product [Bursaphelenchus okinawaensis]|uniref:Uncharacterized protein n=1 Tax=Bursaphelenchus okinawaensis TaxID=465554 RepID=A0A811JQT3_9BILA|nr:unnamed protein product [Bursaphelenchus okinawaensis]CAG9078496.1 unnamed protein product [Bursaphelenchus okinawaensis]
MDAVFVTALAKYFRNFEGLDLAWNHNKTMLVTVEAELSDEEAMELESGYPESDCSSNWYSPRSIDSTCSQVGTPCSAVTTGMSMSPFETTSQSPCVFGIGGTSPCKNEAGWSSFFSNEVDGNLWCSSDDGNKTPKARSTKSSVSEEDLELFVSAIKMMKAINVAKPEQQEEEMEGELDEC